MECGDGAQRHHRFPPAGGAAAAGHPRAAELLKPGGILLYSTCSLEPEENEELIREFLKARPEFSLQAERALTPFKNDCDGAYAARLVKGVKF